MVIDQWDVVMTNVTHIDRLKGDSHKEDAVAGIHEVFGSGSVKRGNGSKFRPDWLSPFTNVCFPSHLEDQIMGFCKPCMRVAKVKEEDYEMTPINASAGSNGGMGMAVAGRRNVGNTAEIV